MPDIDEVLGELEEEEDFYEELEEEEEDMTKRVKADSVIIQTGGDPVGKKKKEEKDEIEEIIKNAPEADREYLRRLYSLEIVRTQVVRKGPEYDADDIKLKIGKVIYDYPNGIVRMDELERELFKTRGGGLYEVLYKDSSGKIRLRRTFEIDGAPIATKLEKEEFDRLRGIRPGRNKNNSEEDPEIKELEKEQKLLLKKREVERTRRKVELEEEEEEYDEDYDDLPPAPSMHVSRRRGRRGGFGMGMMYPQQFEDPDKIRREAEEKADLKHQVDMAKRDAEEAKKEKKGGTDWAAVLTAVVPAALNTIGGIADKMLDKMDKIAESMKPREHDPMAELTKLGEMVKNFIPEKESMEDKIKFLAKAAEANTTMMHNTINSLMSSMVDVMSKRMLDDAGVKEPDTPAVAIVREVSSAVANLGRDIVSASKQKGAQSQAALPQGASQDGGVARHGGVTHHGGITVIPPQQPPQQPPPAASPVPQPQPQQSPGGATAINVPGLPAEQAAFLAKYGPDASKLLGEALNAYNNEVSPEEFAEKTGDLVNDEMLDLLLEKGDMELLRQFAVLSGRGAEFEHLVMGVPVIRSWVEKWLLTVKECYVDDGETQTMSASEASESMQSAMEENEPQ